MRLPVRKDSESNMESGTFRIGISGSYGGLNLGDEAILESMVAQIRSALPVEITVFTRDTEDTLKRHQVEHAVAMRDLTRDEIRAEIERLDLFVLGGGGILYDRDAELYLQGVLLAHEVGVPVMVYAISAGPLTEPNVRDAVRDALNGAAIITTRDRQGQKLLEDVGVQKEIHVTADPALLLQPSSLPDDTFNREGIDPARRLVGLSVREPGPAAPDMDVEHYHRLLANAAQFIVDRFDADIVFVPMERQKMDVQHSHAVIAQMQTAHRATVLKGEYTSGQILSLVSYFQFAVGMRLHFLIFAALQNVPFVALPYASKVTGLLEKLDMKTPPLKDVNTGSLLADIDRSWDDRDAIRKHMRRRLPELQALAQETNEHLVRLITEDLKQTAKAAGVQAGR